MGFEERIAHPSGSQSRGSSVMGPERLAEFIPQARRQIGIAVDGRNALRRKHSAEHRRGFDDERRHPLPRRGNGRCRAGCRTADNQDIDHPTGGFGGCRQCESDGYDQYGREKESCTFHAFDFYE